MIFTMHLKSITKLVYPWLSAFIANPIVITSNRVVTSTKIFLLKHLEIYTNNM
jgi:hypothetical protein